MGYSTLVRIIIAFIHILALVGPQGNVPKNQYQKALGMKLLMVLYYLVILEQKAGWQIGMYSPTNINIKHWNAKRQKD